MLRLIHKNTSEGQNEVCATPVAAKSVSAPAQKYAGTLKIKQSKPTTALTISLLSLEADDVADLVHKIENLKKDDAIDWLGKLEDAHEQTYFEIGGLLSVIQANKWFDPYASFDEWVEKTTAMRRSKARVLVQIYNAISNSGITWAKVEHIGWTKLRAIARALKPENADYWIGFASEHTKKEIIEHVRQKLAEEGAPDGKTSAATHARTFRLHDDQIELVKVALDRVKEQVHTLHDSVALEFLCQDFLAGQTLEQKLPHLSAEATADVLASLFKRYEKDELKEILKSALANFGTFELMDG